MNIKSQFSFFGYPCILHKIYGYKRKPLTEQRAKEILGKTNNDYKELKYYGARKVANK